MPTADYRIQDVWHSNLEEEFRKIRYVVNRYPYVAMDTEFPGVVARPVGEFKNNSDFQYQLLRCNVDLLKIIQVGLTFFDDTGSTPHPTCTWQFNFKFNLTADMYAKESIDLLTECGIQFKKHEEEGIDVVQFAELLMTSGVILSNSVKWISFHSGYDFGYMLKILTCLPIPSDEQEFFELIRIYFPNIYDVKYLMKSCKTLKGGLQEVAEELEVQRVGPKHQAGSDSHLTGQVFFKMREMFFEDHIDDAKYCGHLYGLGAAYVVNGSNCSSLLPSNLSQNNLIGLANQQQTVNNNNNNVPSANSNNCNGDLGGSPHPTTNGNSGPAHSAGGQGN